METLKNLERAINDIGRQKFKIKKDTAYVENFLHCLVAMSDFDMIGACT